MKNKIIFLFVFFILILGFVFAVDYSDLPKTQGELEEKSTGYLEQEWNQFLEKNKIGEIFLSINKIFEALSPLFELIIGIEYSLNWIFFFSLGCWIAIFIISYKSIKPVFQSKNWISYVIGFIIPTLAAQIGIFNIIIKIISPFVKNLFGVLLVILISIILVLIYLSFVNLFSRKMKKKLKAEKESIREFKAKTVEEIHDVELKSRGIKK